jgi:hypothetical protein
LDDVAQRSIQARTHHKDIITITAYLQAVYEKATERGRRANHNNEAWSGRESYLPPTVVEQGFN